MEKVSAMIAIAAVSCVAMIYLGDAEVGKMAISGIAGFVTGTAITVKQQKGGSG